MGDRGKGTQTEMESVVLVFLSSALYLLFLEFDGVL